MTRREEAVWERGWDGHSQSQLHRLARLPLAEKIRWLEEAQQLVTRLSGERDCGAATLGDRNVPSSDSPARESSSAVPPE
jgi:hypothetical protein